MMLRVILSVLFLLGATYSTMAASVFNLVGFNSNALTHPADSDVRRSASGSWGSAATGGGFLDGTLTLNDGFALPSGGSVAFGASDILSIAFQHTESALVSGGSISPSFGFSAANANIVSATGTVTDLGGGSYEIAALAILTDLNSGLLPILPGGTISGDILVDGNTFGVRPASGPDQLFTVNSQYPGHWRLTSITNTVPLPAALPLLAGGLGLLGLAGWRRRTRTA